MIWEYNFIIQVLKSFLELDFVFQFKEQKWHWHVLNIHLTAENWVADYPIDYVQTNVSQH